MREDARFETWCPNVVVLDGQMIGHAGYRGPPGQNSTQNPDAVEFGYTIYPDWRGRGYATQAAVTLMDLSPKASRHSPLRPLGQPGERSVAAIVRKLGFVKTGEHMDDEDGLEHVFELRR